MDTMRHDLIGAYGKAETIEAFARHVSSGKAAFFKAAGIDFVLGRRDGPYLWDLESGKRLIDCHCNGGVFNLGHRNPEMVRLLTRSLQELDIGNHHLISEPRAALAGALSRLTPGNLAFTVFGVGGGEAIDLAIKVARGYSRKAKIVSAAGGYHGHTGLAMAAGDPKYRAPFGPPAPGFEQTPFNDLDALEHSVDEDTAAVLLETIPATCGILIPDAEFLRRARDLCDRQGALLIIDEVQTGLGRTGRLWGIEHFAVLPDILVIGKGLSGGVYPITATCFRQELESVFHPEPFIHVSTFGGAEVGCPVALRVLEIASEESFLAHVRELAALFSRGLGALQAGHPRLVAGYRQLGLMMGLVLHDERCGPLFTKIAFDNGLLSVYANNDPRVAQLLPPLNIDQELVTEILERIDQSLTEMERMLP